MGATLDNDRIIQIITETANANFASVGVARVIVEPAIDSTGADALRITVVLAFDGDLDSLGDALLDTLAQCHRRLDAAGETRLPLIDFVTEGELAEPDDEVEES